MLHGWFVTVKLHQKKSDRSKNTELDKFCASRTNKQTNKQKTQMLGQRRVNTWGYLKKLQHI
jgi:hypothetical protein